MLGLRLRESGVVVQTNRIPGIIAYILKELDNHTSSIIGFK